MSRISFQWTGLGGGDGRSGDDARVVTEEYCESCLRF